METTSASPTGFQDIEQIKQANREAGRFFFSPDTMRFFASRVLPTVYGGRFFVTSEKRGFDDDGREYRVRVAFDNGEIETVEFRRADGTEVKATDSRDSAVTLARALAGVETVEVRPLGEGAWAPDMPAVWLDDAVAAYSHDRETVETYAREIAESIGAKLRGTSRKSAA